MPKPEGSLSIVPGVLLVLILAFAAPANAANVRVEETRGDTNTDRLVFAAAPQENNDVTIRVESVSTLVISDTGVGSLEAGSGCRLGSAPAEVRCDIHEPTDGQEVPCSPPRYK